VGLPISLLLPFLVWQSAWYEWANYYWLIMQQQHGLTDGLLPTYFVHTAHIGLFYPVFAFTGGTLWWLAALVSEAVGSAWVAFLLLLIAANLSSYWGTWWFARQVGLSRRLANLPAVAIVTSSYAVTNLYGRGDWAEIVASGAMPLAFASALHILRSPTVRPAVLAAFVVTSVFIAGSDAPVLLCCALFVIGVALVILVTRLRGDQLQMRRIALLGLAGACAAGVSGWWLIPDLAYAHLTYIYGESLGFVRQHVTGEFDRLAVVLLPWRSNAGSQSEVFLQAPVQALAWGLVAAPVALSMGGRLRRAVLGCLVGVVALTTLLTCDALWTRLPHLVQEIQFPYRFETFLGFATAGLLIVGLLAVKNRSYVWPASLVVLLVVASGLAEHQAWSSVALPVALPIGRVQAVLPPPSFSGTGQLYGFRFELAPVTPINDPGDLFALQTSVVRESEAQVNIGTLSVPFVVTVLDTPFVSVSGARVMGQDQNDYFVLDPIPAARGVVTFHAAVPTPVAVGRAISIASLIGLVALLALAMRRRRHPRLS
jgi:hypothetical protein